MRIFIAALIGAIIIFIWQMAAHMVLPIGEMGMKAPPNEDVVIQAVASGTPEPGIYMLPHFDMAKADDTAALAAWETKAKANRYSWLVVAPANPDPMNMGPQLGKQFASNLLSALIAAWLLAATAWGFGARIVGSVGIGLFGWLSNVVPQWNWYQFPAGYMAGGLLEQGIGWLLAGIGIAWWLSRK